MMKREILHSFDIILKKFIRLLKKIIIKKIIIFKESIKYYYL